MTTTATTFNKGLPIRTNYRVTNLNVLYGEYQDPQSFKNIPLQDVVRENGEIRVTGYMGEVWNVFEQAMNFSTSLTEMSENSWGKIVNGRWTGVVGSILRGELDVSAAGVGITPTRLQAVDFILPFKRIRALAFLQATAISELAWASAVRPFSPPLWLACIVVGLLTAFVSAIALCVRSRARARGPTATTAVEEVLVSLGALFCQQSHNLAARRGPHRLSFVLVYALGSVLLASYSASITSIRAVRYQMAPFSSLSELAQDRNTILVIDNRTMWLEVVKRGETETLRALYRKYKHYWPRSLGAEYLTDLHRACAEERLAVVVPLEVAVAMAPQLNCSVEAVPELFFKMIVGIPIRKNSPYKHLFDSLVLRMWSAGVLQRLNSRTWPPWVVSHVHRRPRERQRQEGLQPPVALDDCLPAVVAAAAGCLLALLLLAAELAVAAARTHRAARDPAAQP